MARPSKANPKGTQKKPKLDNPETVRKLEEAFEMDCSIPEACLHADISKQTYYDLIAYKPKLVDRFEELRNTPVYNARKTITTALKTDNEIALKYLERKRKSEFSTKVEQEFSGPGGKDLFPELTPQQYKQIGEQFTQLGSVTLLLGKK